MPHVLTASQFGREQIDRLFARTDAFRSMSPQDQISILRHKIVILLFYEPSTRTRMSFELAARRLGADTVGTEAAGMFSSAAKGETLEDTVRVLAGYGADAIVIRHKECGAAERAALVSPIPIVNAGDGAGEHPTQALLDLYTILHHMRGRKEITLALAGDLEHSRTVRSLCRLLIRYGPPPSVRLLLVSPAEIRLGGDVRDELLAANIPFQETDRFAEAVHTCDILYQTRVQRERYGESAQGESMYAAIQSRFSLTAKHVSFMKPDAIVLHPLPRLGEISTDVDADPRAKYFAQAANGLFVRMALLEYLLLSDG